MVNMFRLLGTEIEKFPSPSVWVLILVPLTTTVAPAMEVFSGLLTLPTTVRCWAKVDEKTRDKHRTTNKRKASSFDSIAIFVEVSK